MDDFSAKDHFILWLKSLDAAEIVKPTAEPGFTAATEKVAVEHLGIVVHTSAPEAEPPVRLELLIEKLPFILTERVPSELCVSSPVHVHSNTVAPFLVSILMFLFIRSTPPTESFTVFCNC